jgi:hypothetical protein
MLMFPDNTVLVNFAIINRMDLLGRLVRDNGRWCATAARECERSADVAGLAALDDAREIFGDPLFPDQAELQDTVIIRDELAGPGDSRYQHLGEAETLAIVTRRGLTCFFATDDREAARLAAKKNIPTADTWRLLSLAYRQGWLDADTFWGYVQTIRVQGRKGPRGVSDRLSFDKWLPPLPGPA